MHGDLKLIKAIQNSKKNFKLCFKKKKILQNIFWPNDFKKF